MNLCILWILSDAFELDTNIANFVYYGNSTPKQFFIHIVSDFFRSISLILNLLNFR